MNKEKVGIYSDQIRGVSYKEKDLHDTLNDQSVILLRANNIFENELNFDNVVFVDKSRVSQKQYLRKGDIVVCASSGSKNLVGKAAQVDFDVKVTFGAFLKVIRPKNIVNEYLGYYFLSSEYRRTISSISEGANINNIRNEHLDDLLVPIIDRDTQNERAKILGIVSKILKCKRLQLSDYDQLIKSRFVEMFEYMDLSKQQKNWIKLGEVSEIVTGTTPSTNQEINWGGHHLWITPAEIDDNSFYVFNTKRKLTDEGVRSKSLTVMPVNTVLLSTRAPIGKAAIVGTPMSCNQGFKNFICKDNLNPIYLFTLLKYNKEYLNSIGSGTTFKEISKSAVSNIVIPVPNIMLQKQFAQFYRQVDKLKF